MNWTPLTLNIISIKSLLKSQIPSFKELECFY